MIRLDIFADPVCPWCLIGKARLDRALEARPNHPFVIAWHPFQLNPAMPAGGMPRAAYLEAKFGRADAARYYVQVLDAAKESGIELDVTSIQTMPNTRDAHRLIHWAGIEGRQTPVFAALMRAYWREGSDIGDAEVLADIGAQMGMDRDMVTRLLASDADLDVIAERETHARERGVNAVPTFVIANQYVLSGAQPTETWLQVIDELLAQDSPAD
ncbi:DsbA family protein [Sedimentimonas flavescens]|uniref:DsbA family oxidoreductase n=1 Tax=Sedimentimonas flavescens TaxID=2851012 RepID=UPI001C4A132F|nr:DsbA family oxidoreductase [Sedimentimonas flavescens]MBW0157104.1 DsbA family oxidoreductase [Sedimentimonas flavescens]